MKTIALLAIQLPAVLSQQTIFDWDVDQNCGNLRDFFRSSSCCGDPNRDTLYKWIPTQSICSKYLRPFDVGTKDTSNCPADSTKEGHANECTTKVVGGARGPKQKPSFGTIACANAIVQSGTDVTYNYDGAFTRTFTVNTQPFFARKMCPVNVHWYLGANHKSSGQYDSVGDTKAGTAFANGPPTNPAGVRRGYRCNNHYNQNDPKYTTTYNFKYCKNMVVGETYEVHWPHSTLGMCGMPEQYQTPFVDGLFCTYDAALDLAMTDQDRVNNLGVQVQVFTVVNDEYYYYPSLMRGMIEFRDQGWHKTIYAGSATGTGFNNGAVCSNLAPITYHVDRRCHLISASSFDKLCSDMLSQADDMTADVSPKGTREMTNADKQDSDPSNFGNMPRRLDGVTIHDMVYEGE